jgi:hypothetical protein
MEEPGISKVLPLRKKLKILMHPQALRDLEDDGPQ